MSIPLFAKRDGATRKKAVAGDTLNKLATDAGLPDWKSLAMFNWGTVEPAEVNRALFETIGWDKANADDPGATVLKPHVDADRELLIPQAWAPQTGFALDAVHTIKLKPTVAPPVAISIDTLSRWFIPKVESCDLSYSTEGAAANAAVVQFEVYGSNYCSLTDWNKGLPKFPDAADLVTTPLYESEEQSAAPARAKGVAVKEWKGRVSATTGVLGKKTGTEDRVVNAAFSPYTVLLRYLGDPGDKATRLELDAFWPSFDSAGNAEAASLKIRFAVRGGDRVASTTGGGTLLVVDGQDRIVYRKPLSLAEMGKLDSGWRTLDWSGDYSAETPANSAGGRKVIAADMPYRVQVQVHTGPDQAKGLALAAMSTEVRLYVHPKTHLPTLDPYVAETDMTTLVLGASPELLITKPAVRGDGTRWVQYQLAKAGFHAGPCDGSAGREAYKTALREFKRSVPKRKAGATFQRQTIDLTEGASVLDAVEDLAADATRQRPWFGSAADRSDLAADAAATVLRDHSKSLVVWADDRHHYTDGSWLQSCGTAATAVYNRMIADPAAMLNYGMAYTDGDAVADMKLTEIPRPWLPLSAGLPLLSKGQKLDAELTFTEQQVLAMAAAVGPIRVDWSVDEIDAKPPVDAVIDKTHYDVGVARTKAYVEHQQGKYQAAPYTRKDIVKKSIYTNCRVVDGGVRPPAEADYAKAVFATADDSLAPWRGNADAAFETVYAVVHDNLGQADDAVVADRRGRAGIFFRPSTVGGDGYRVRAQVRFDSHADYKLPNLETLKKRYPRLPQAQSASLRVWRKATLRGYISWSPSNSWAALNARFREHFREAYLHLTFEKNDAAIGKAIGDYFANDAAFKALVKSALHVGGGASAGDLERAKDIHIAMHAQRLWPWYGAPQFGIFEASAPGAAKAAAVQTFYGVVDSAFDSLSNTYTLEWVRKIEQSTGKLRGHVVVEFQCGDDFFAQQYKCDSCSNTYYFAEKTAAGGSKVDADCPSGCGGALKTQASVITGHYTCANGHAGSWAEDTIAGGKFHGMKCVTAGCRGGVYRGTYRCGNGHQVTGTEDNAVGGKYNGAACTTVGCVGSRTGNYVCNSASTPHNFSFPEASAVGGSHTGAACATCAGLGKVRTLVAAVPHVVTQPSTYVMQSVAEAAAVLSSVQAPMQAYTCATCAWTGKLFEPGAGGSHVGEGCPAAACAGVLASSGAVAPANKVTLDGRGAASGYKGIPVPSIGNALGVSMNSDGNHELWAHELGHNRYLEHAANAGGPNDADHDHAPNGSFNWAGLPETVATAQGWDRTCLMTYVTHLKTYSAVRDRRIMCGKCNLKVRGWKLASLVDPGDVVHD